MDRRRELAGLGQVEALSKGAVLFADISGFTRITEELGRTLGPRRGAEELTTLLNRVFGPITAAIDRQNGSIISFGGDSVMSWFADDNGTRATAVGLELVTILREFRQTEQGPAAALDLKAAVASGSAHRMRVGQAQTWLPGCPHRRGHRLAGGRVEPAPSRRGRSQPAVASALADRGQLRTVTENGRVRHLVEEMTETPRPEPALDTDFADPVTAGEWLLPFVREHLEQGLSGLMGQLRDVVTMFVGFGHQHSESSEQHETFDVFVSRAQEVVASYEGMVLQALIDEKGPHFYAVFGASMAHQDESRRAVVAAQELVGAADSGSTVRVGIASGAAYVGAYGGGHRMTFGVIGPSVNMAARLMQEAVPGSIFVTEHIARQTGQQTEFTDIGPIQLKGIETPGVGLLHLALGGTPFGVTHRAGLWPAHRARPGACLARRRAGPPAERAGRHLHYRGGGGYR